MGDERTGDAAGLEARLRGGGDLVEDLAGSEGIKEKGFRDELQQNGSKRSRNIPSNAVDSLAASFHAKVFRQEGMTPISTPVLPDEQEICSEKSVVH
ncbi:hypothetical protein HDU96_000751 [Phlyctochytrium bullatum]|nr:hypothetical protein HDU96_000751 [Phlyctochytrium bullatum]